MSLINYAQIRKAAKDALAGFGRVNKLVLTVTTYGTPDFATGESTDTTTNYSFDAVTVGYKLAEIDGVRVMASDLRVIAEAGPILAPVGATVSIDGAVHRVIHVEQVNTGGVLLLQKWQVRK